VTTDSVIAEEVQALERLDLAGLRAKWRRRWGEPPRYRSRELMANAIAHRLQVEALGDLPAPIRRKLAELERQFRMNPRFQPVPGPKLAPGCSILREWGGARHEVIVLEQGFAYGGQRFSSLSKVAEHITGTKRSGVLFFGLKQAVS
jgi:hypothetical protein